MKALYITSVEPFSGKTALCLALGTEFQARGHELAFLKPLSTQPWRSPQGELADEDAVFVSEILGLDQDPDELSPVIVTPERLRQRLSEPDEDGLLDTVTRAAETAAQKSDILLLEGGGSLREGYAMGLSNLRVAQTLGAPVLVMVKYRGEMEAVDDALTAEFRLEDQLLGVIFNQVPQEKTGFIDEYAGPFLQRRGIQVLGALRTMPRLSALSVDELIDLLEAQVLTEGVATDRLADTFTVGAMNAEAALSRFRRQRNKAVITGGDRTDIQLAALETSTVALILTGNLQPSPLILEQAEALGVPVLLVETNTMETVERIERNYGKTRLGQREKLETFTELVKERVDMQPILAALDLA